MLFDQEDILPNSDSTWTVPTTFPRLDAAKSLSIDIETKDPKLRSHGPGNIRKDGHIVGLAVGTNDGQRFYFPMRHEVDRGMNFDPQQVMRWANDELTRAHQPKVGANIMYDIGWLRTEGVRVQGQLHDVQFYEALIDEYARSYTLDAIAYTHLREGKKDNALYEWCAKAYGGSADRSQAANIYRASPKLVGPYAEGDVDLPLRILREQLKIIQQEDLTFIAQLEHDLIPMLLDMRERGVRIDTNKAEQLSDYLQRKRAAAIDAIRKLTGVRVDVWAPESIAKAFDKAGIVYPRTKKTKAPSFTADWLENHESELAAYVREARKYDKAKETFVDGYLNDHIINGRIHCQFHPLRNDDYGTVSGRFSSSDPNLQQVPSRDPELGPLVRGLFIPEENEVWHKLDYSQIEPRIFLSYSRGQIAEEMIAEYQRNPSMNCYRKMEDYMPAIGYAKIKGLYLGLTYCMGPPTLARHLHMSVEESQPLAEQFHEGAPYVKDLIDRVKARADDRGFIKTKFGRRARFNLFESVDFKTAKKEGAFDETSARKLYKGRIRRAYTYKAINRLIQGTAADVMKLAMRKCYSTFPDAHILLTCHDEQDISAPDTRAGREMIAECKHIMQTCADFAVPLCVDAESGPSWGEVK